MKLRKTLAMPLILAILALGAFAGTASAHECVIASRSDTGQVAAAHSANWVNVGSLDFLFTFLAEHPEFIGQTQALTPGQVEWAVQEAMRQGIPGELTIFTRFTLLEGTPAGSGAKMGNGRGVDYLENLLPKIVVIYGQALTH